MNEHVPATCCRHIFTLDCPIDCLMTVVSKTAFSMLARAYDAPFDPPGTVGQVIELLREGRLGQAAGLGPRRIGEIQAGLVFAGLIVGDTLQ